MRVRWMVSLLAVPVAAAAQPRPNSVVDTTVAKSAAARSMLRAIPVLQRAIDAVTSRGNAAIDALRSLSSLSTDRTMVVTKHGQGLHPGAPSVVHAVLLTRIDRKASRIFRLRDLEIDGGQIWGSGTIITPSAGYDLHFGNRTYGTGSAGEFANQRVALLRGEVPTLLLSAWNRPETLRSLGTERMHGRPSDVISFADADGSLVTLYMDHETHLPLRSEVLADNPTRGDQAVSTDYSDYRPVQGFRLPFKTIQDGPGPERWEAVLTKVELNTAIADSLFVPPSVLTLNPGAAPTFKKLSDGVYGMSEGAVIEFRDFVVVFEAYGSSRASEGKLANIRRTFPGKPIRYVVSSHYHDDHLGGVRPFGAEGVTFLTTRDAEPRIREVLASRHEMRADTFSVRANIPAIEIIERSRVIEDGTQRLELYQIGPTAHVDQMLVGYLPKEKILIEGDLLDIGEGSPNAGGEDTEQLAAKLRELHLDVERIIPIHGMPGTLRDLQKALDMHRARASCPRELVQRLYCEWNSR